MGLIACAKLQFRSSKCFPFFWSRCKGMILFWSCFHKDVSPHASPCKHWPVAEIQQDMTSVFFSFSFGCERMGWRVFGFLSILQMWWPEGTGRSSRHLWSRTPVSRSPGALPALVNVQEAGFLPETVLASPSCALHSFLVSLATCWIYRPLFAPFALALHLSFLLHETSRRHEV